MRIAIVGAGVAGRSLYRFMELDGITDAHDVEIFDLERPHTRCRIHPCAWGVKTPEWERVCGMLETKKRILRKFTRINRDGEMIRCDLCTINKPKFLDDICPEDNIQRGGFDGDCSKYDIVVDATGEKRAILPPLKDDMKITCRQALFKTSVENIDMTIVPSPSVGYSWIFPINDRFAHIGQGAMKWDFGFVTPSETIKALKYAGVENEEPVCGWYESQIRLMAPAYSVPITSENVVGVGEAAGCVSPHTGAGIMTGILSARLLADYIMDSDDDFLCIMQWMHQYERAIISEFGFLNRETRIIRKIVNNKPLNLLDLICLYRNIRYFGMYPGPKQVIDQLKMVGARFL